MTNYKALFLIPAIYFLLSLPAGAHSPGESFSPHFSGTLFHISEKELFSAEMLLPDNKITTGYNTPWIIIHDSDDRDVLGAKLAVEARHQDRPEESSLVYDAREAGHGLYVVPNLVIAQPGNWQLRVMVEKDSQKDDISFDFSGVREKEQTSDPFAARQTGTQNKMVMKYTPSRDIVAGQGHDWQLRITTPDGRPVTGFNVEVTGVQLETGSPLSEQARTSGRAGRGNYLAQDMLFPESGPWSVVFLIFTATSFEIVEFQLKVDWILISGKRTCRRWSDLLCGW